jgi:predicted oxidoreductase
MKTIEIGRSGMRSSVLAYGCSRLAGTWSVSDVTPDGEAAGRRAIFAAFDSGFTFFDNSDIYTNGVCERILGRALRDASGMRNQVIVATKGGIRRSGDPYPDSVVRYDLSRDYLLHACDGSLKRLGVEPIDLYMLHREDYLGSPAELAEVFDILHKTGKVRWFGVSNFRPAFVSALMKFSRQPIVAHQLEISLARLEPFSDGSLDQCLAEQMTPLAWSPLAAGLIGDGATRLLPGQSDYRLDDVLPVLDEIAGDRGMSRAVIALAWLMRHPSKIIPIVGSVNPDRIRETSRAAEVKLDREEWYRLFVAAHGQPLP